jgi:hypothetical protein
VVEPDTDGRSSVLRDHVVGDPKRDEHCVGRLGDSEHQGIADRLDVLTSNGRQLRLHCVRELFDQHHGLLITVRLGQGGEAREVREDECAGAVRHRPRTLLAIERGVAGRRPALPSDWPRPSRRRACTA